MLLTIVLQIEAKARTLLLQIRALAGERVEDFSDDVPISFRVNARDFEQEPLGCLIGVKGFPPWRKMDQDHQLEQAPGEILLRVVLKQHWNLASKIGKEFLCDRQELLLDLEQVGEMVHDRVGSEQVSPRLIQEWGDSSRFVSKQLRQCEVDDAAGLRKAVAHFFE